MGYYSEIVVFWRSQTVLCYHVDAHLNDLQMCFYEYVSGKVLLTHFVVDYF